MTENNAKSIKKETVTGAATSTVATTLDNIRLLSTVSSDINNLLVRIKDSKKQLDGVSRSIKLKEKEFIALQPILPVAEPPQAVVPPAITPATAANAPVAATAEAEATQQTTVSVEIAPHNDAARQSTPAASATTAPAEHIKPPYKKPEFKEDTKIKYFDNASRRQPGAGGSFANAGAGTYNNRPPYNPSYNNASRPQGTGAVSRPTGQGAGSYNRPAGGFGGYNSGRGGAGGGVGGTANLAPMPFKPTFTNNKKAGENKNKYDDKKTPTFNKRQLNTRGFFDPLDEEGGAIRRYKNKKPKEVYVFQPVKISEAYVNTTEIPLKSLAEKIGVPATDIIKKLFKEGIAKNINDTLDYDFAAVLSADLGIKLELRLDKTFEEILKENDRVDNDGRKGYIKRPPIVTVMGHVDHGKTSLLDSIRNTNVMQGEAGGITQHIGAYTVALNGNPITFIDTPGHEAFTAMRARGARLTDVAILVIAADDGVMPQTIEAIDHIKAAEVPMIVALNKIDKPAANIDRVKQQLTEQGVVPEEWGGDTIVVSVSAKNNIGIATLLESVLLVADMKELKADPRRKAKGVVVEAKLDKGKGPVATVLIQNGTLKTGDTIVAGTVVGKLRALIDDSGVIVKQARPSYAVSILGLSDVPNAGDFFYVVDEKLSKQVAEERKNKQAAQRIQQAAKITLDDVFNKISEGQLKALNVIVKADVQGSMEALKQSLIKISNEEVKINPIHGGVGAITETDVMLAKASGAVIIGFNIKADAKARQLADKENVEIRHYRIIYEAIDDITKTMKGLLKPKFEELPLGRAEVRQLFKFEGTSIAGCMITEGKVVRNGKIRLLREGAEIYSGSISTLKRFKDDAKEVAAGYECGISIEGFNDIKENDIIEAYQIKEIEIK